MNPFYYCNMTILGLSEHSQNGDAALYVALSLAGAIAGAWSGYTGTTSQQAALYVCRYFELQFGPENHLVKLLAERLSHAINS